MKFPITIKIISPGDARGWIGLGCYVLVIFVLVMIGWSDKQLLDNDFFKVLATAIVLTGWNNGPVGWAYQATKGGGEAAESSARIAEKAAERALPKDGPAGTEEDPLKMEGKIEGKEDGAAVTTKPHNKP